MSMKDKRNLLSDMDSSNMWAAERAETCDLVYFEGAHCRNCTLFAIHCSNTNIADCELFSTTFCSLC